MTKVIFFYLEETKNNVTCFFYKQHFHKQHQVDVWSKIITIKRTEKSKHWNICWVKSITAIKSIHYQWKVLPTICFGSRVNNIRHKLSIKLKYKQFKKSGCKELFWELGWFCDGNQIITSCWFILQKLEARP